MPTIEQIVADENAKRAAFEARERFKGFTIATLREAFNRITAVMPDNDWKREINALVLLREFDLMAAAVEFFTASELKIICTDPEKFGDDRKAYVKAPGYYAAGC